MKFLVIFICGYIHPIRHYFMISWAWLDIGPGVGVLFSFLSFFFCPVQCRCKRRVWFFTQDQSKPILSLSLLFFFLSSYGCLACSGKRREAWIGCVTFGSGAVRIGHSVFEGGGRQTNQRAENPCQAMSKNEVNNHKKQSGLAVLGRHLVPRDWSHRCNNRPQTDPSLSPHPFVSPLFSKGLGSALVKQYLPNNKKQ